ncbi:hypothetical protein TEA_020392 [Camellia sinensis var. sinensis]|uniref:Dymeclin n=1 Tax=Camellia sinensis var. sinensis TaxID=542762 RepID=A0A4S4ESG1_CAMSN|nr:hypothetical protein TEA_020392 [Camellia sinensis var. sinensis]
MVLIFRFLFFRAILISIYVGRNIENLVMHSVLSFIGKVDVSPNTYLLHQELLNFMLVAMSTQLLSGPSPGPKDIHPFIDMAMVQESSFVGLVVRKLLLNYIMRPHFALNTASYDMFSEGNQSGVLQRVGSATGVILHLSDVLIFSPPIVLMVFSAFGFVHKIATFEKAAGFQALILARLLGQRIDLDNIKVESLYPEEMGPNIMHVEDFLVHGLPLLDKGIQERVEN